MQKNSKLSISPNSGRRVHYEAKSYLRNDFQRDRDRIIHSTAFRRLKHKTQVFVNTSGDHYRTRITHSLEVSQIARTLAKIFKLNEDLCETLSLAHDLGHTPFGHAGEKILNECMESKGGFDHNIQTLRIVTLLENKYYNFRGLNLCIETIDGLIKHNGPVYELEKFDSILGRNFFKNQIKFENQPSLEAQVASLSDDIAYNSHDLEDGLKANLFKIEELKDLPVISDIIYKHKNKLKYKNKDLILRQIIRDIINEMVKDVVFNTKKNLKKEKPKNIKNIYNSKAPLICFSSKMSEFDQSLKEFLKYNMYFNESVLRKTNKGKKIISKLFYLIKKNPKKFIKENMIVRNNKERSTCDFIAGMTDRYAIKLYNSLK